MEKEMVSASIKDRWTNFEKQVRAFSYTDWYLCLVCLIVFTAWLSKSATFGFVGLILLSCFVLVTSDDILPLTVNVFSAALMIYTSKVDDYVHLWPCFIPLVLSIAVFAVRNFKKKNGLGKMFFPQIAVSFALIIGGVGIVSAGDYVRALPTVLFLGIGVLVVYLLFCLFSKQDEKRDIAMYYAKTMMYIGIVVCLELLIVIMRSDLAPANWNTSYWDVGWGNRNNIATYLVFTAPMCLYIAMRSKRPWFFIIIGMMQYVCLIMTFSRGGIIFGAVGGVFAMVITILKAKNRKSILISWGVVAALGIVAYLCLMKEVNDMIGSLISRGMGTSGRDILYEEAWELFKQHPIQGVGMGYMGTGPCPITDMNMYLFHSTLFQVMADMGIIGILCYGFYYVTRCLILFKNIKNKFNLIMLAVWIGFEGYSMIDTGTMVPFPSMVLIIVGVFILEKLAGTTNFEGYVDEYNSTIAYTKALFKKQAVEEAVTCSDATLPDEITVAGTPVTEAEEIIASTKDETEA